MTTVMGINNTVMPVVGHNRLDYQGSEYGTRYFHRLKRASTKKSALQVAYIPIIEDQQSWVIQ